MNLVADFSEIGGEACSGSNIFRVSQAQFIDFGEVDDSLPPSDSDKNRASILILPYSRHPIRVRIEAKMVTVSDMDFQGL